MKRVVIGLLVVLVVLGGALYYADQRLNQMYNNWYTTQIEKPSTPRKPVKPEAPATLNGTIHSIHGDEITRELWMKMREYNVSDPRIQPYVEWLRWAFDDPDKALNVKWYPHYRYWWFNNRYGWDRFPNTTLVKVGRIQLPYGANLIVTALQDGGGVDVVVHGTLTNPRDVLNLTAQSLLYMTDQMSSMFYYKARDFGYPNYSIRTGWVLWRIEIEGQGSKLVVDGTSHPIKKIYILLEMPVYLENNSMLETTSYMWHPEYLYWVLLGYPAFGLAFNLAYPPSYDVWSIYRNDVNELIHTMITETWHCHTKPGRKLGFHTNVYTPFYLRAKECGVCEDFSEVTSLLASVMGVYSSVITLPAYGAGHALSVLVLPSSRGLKGRIELGVDVDGDGVPDTGDVIVDTAKLTTDYINEYMEGVWMYPPLQWRPIVVDGNEHPKLPGEYEHHPLKMLEGGDAEKLMYSHAVGNQLAPLWTGVLPAYQKLPAWLAPPWMNKLPPSMTPWSLTPKAKELLDMWMFYKVGHDRCATTNPDPAEFVEEILEGRSGIPYIDMNTTYWTRVMMLILENKTSTQLQTPPSIALTLRGVTVNGEPEFSYIPVIDSFLLRSKNYK